MNAWKHPSTALLARYAAGDLPRPPFLAVAAHVEACPACQTSTRAVEEAEARSLESLPPAEIRTAGIDRLMALIETEGQQEREPRRILGDVTLPDAMSEVKLRSRRWLGPGFWVAHVDTSPVEGWRAFVIRAPAGSRIPKHGHTGDELVTVLSGGFRDGEAFRAGDFVENLVATEHQLQIDVDGPCACLIAVQGRIDWRGWAKASALMLGI